MVSSPHFGHFELGLLLRFFESLRDSFLGGRFPPRLDKNGLVQSSLRCSKSNIEQQVAKFVVDVASKNRLGELDRDFEQFVRVFLVRLIILEERILKVVFVY